MVAWRRGLAGPDRRADVPPHDLDGSDRCGQNRAQCHASGL